MIIIKSIHIKNFRSIVDETIELSDINFFVGKNDCGKSNVLKALNLFFNDETDFGSSFDFSSDYSKHAKRVAKHAKEITISLEISIPGTFQESGVKTWTKVWRSTGLHSNNLERIFKRGSKGITLLNRIRYMYIPAVKSNEYFKYLLSQVYLSMTQTANSTLKELNEEYSSQLQTLTIGLSNQLKNVLNLKSAIKMPDDLNVLFRDLTFTTSDSLVQGIDLDHRGDGIKARHIPSILRYMQKNIEKFKIKNAISNCFIWGYEEPENGVEYLSCFEMADELYSYCADCQMLITTHSPAFYIKSERSNANCLYVYKNECGTSQYDPSISANEIDERIGFMPLIAPYISREREKHLEHVRMLNNRLLDITKKYEKIAGKIVIITEGKTDTKHIRFAFEQLNVGSDHLKKFEYYDFANRNTLGDELIKLLKNLSNMPNDNIIIGIFDRDKHVQHPDPGKAYSALGNRVFRFNIPALSNGERLPDDKICIEHYYSNAEIKTKTQYGHLYMGEDFNTHGLSNDGKWCFHNFESNQSITPISIIDRDNIHMQKLCDDAHIITKDDFAEYVINHPREFDFSNFQRIFDVILAIEREVLGFSEKDTIM